MAKGARRAPAPLIGAAAAPVRIMRFPELHSFQNCCCKDMFFM